MRRFLGAFLLSAVLVTPIVLRADDDDHHRANRAQRYYDRDARDWHEWNGREQEAYRHYLEEQHREYRDWARIKRREQDDYWRWRHTHPDTVIFHDGR
jgi:hypothetical protein